jgi:hypothetical protein
MLRSSIPSMRRMGTGVAAAAFLVRPHADQRRTSSAPIGERGFDGGTKQCSSQPWAGVEELTHAVAGDLVKLGEWGLGDDGAEIWFHCHGLQELGGAHGFSERIDATRVQIPGKPFEPIANVVALKQAAGGDRSLARAVRAGIRLKDGVVVVQEQLSVAGHADTVVAQAV